MRTPKAISDEAFVFWLSVAQLISWGSVFYGFSVFLQPTEQALGMGRAESSLGFSLALLAEGLLAYPVGRLIDRGHERAIMTWGSIWLGASLLGLSVVQNLWQFWLAWLMLGVGLSATLYPPAFAVLTRRFPTHFRRSIIAVTFLGGLASTVFIPLMAWLIDLLQWREALWVLAGFQFLICAPLHHLLLHSAPQQSLLPPGHDQHARDPGLRHHLQQPTFWLIGVFVVLLLGVTAAMPAHMIELLRESGLSERWVILAPALIGAMQVIGRMTLYVLEKRVDAHMTNRLMPCLIPLGLLFLLWGQGQVWAAMCFVLFYGVGNGLLTIVKGTAIAQYVSQAHTASLNGALGLPLALARAGAPFLLGLLWSPQGGYALGLWVMWFTCLVGIAALWWAQHRALHRRRS
jgi:MFS family permease